MNTFIKKMSKISGIMLLALLILASCAPEEPEETLPLQGQETVAEEQEEAVATQIPEDKVATEEPSPTYTSDPATLASDEPRPFLVEAEKPSNSQADESTTLSNEVIESKETKPNTPAATVTICNSDELPDIITNQPVAWEPGDTVLDLLIRTTREHGIHLAYRGRGKTGYVEGINNLYEFDNGPASGWVYSVNGVFPDRSAGGWEVAEGDSIVWWYTLDAGRDVGVFSP